MYREHTKVVQIGDKKIGGGNPILIQLSLIHISEPTRRS